MIAVHVGFPKTATTFLQTEVFPRFAGREFTYVPLDACARLFQSLIDDDDTIYDWRGTAERVREATGDAKVALFSYEALTGHPVLPGLTNRPRIARRLRQVGFDRVVITIRNQFDVLESAYKQYLGRGGVLELRDYIAFDQSETTCLDPRYFDYHVVYGLYASTFGSSHVLLLQQERLREPEFLGQLANFLCAEPITVDWRAHPNKSPSRETLTVLRLFGRAAHGSPRLSRLVPKRLSEAAVAGLLRLPLPSVGRSFHDQGTRASVASFYADSNRRLAEAAGIQLTPAYPGFD